MRWNHWAPSHHTKRRGEERPTMWIRLQELQVMDGITGYGMDKERRRRERGDSEAARAKESLIVRIEFGQANGRGI